MSNHAWMRLRKPVSFFIQSKISLAGDPASSAIPRSTIKSRPFSTHSGTNNAVPQFPPAKRLAGQTCMVTGGTSGIGFAIAERFLQEDASSIILVGRSQERLESAAASLRASPDVNHSNMQSSHESIVLSPDKIRLLVGDVADAGSWMRELEKDMVGFLRNSVL